MRILFLTNKLPWPLKDGGAIGTFSISYALGKLGHNVDMLSINTSKHRINIGQIPEWVTKHLHIQDVKINTDICPLKAVHNLLFCKKPYIATRFYHEQYKRVLVQMLKEKSYDIIILELLYMGLYIPIIRENSNAHITMRAPNIEHEIWKRIAANESHFLKKWYLNNLSKRIYNLEMELLNTYDSLMPVSKLNAKTYEKMGLQRPIAYATTGIFTENLPDKNNHPVEDGSLFHIGALDWRPNIEGLQWFISHCWQDIRKEKPDASLYIAGRNASRDAIRMFNQAGIKYLGEVENAYEFMQSRQIMVVPLLSGSGMRVKIIEGMALGKCIISTSIGAEGIDVSDNDNILLADSPSEFTRLTLKMLDNTKRCTEIGTNARTFAKAHYDNLKIAQNLVDFYEEILK